MSEAGLGACRKAQPVRATWPPGLRWSSPLAAPATILAWQGRMDKPSWCAALGVLCREAMLGQNVVRDPDVEPTGHRGKGDVMDQVQWPPVRRPHEPFVRRAAADRPSLPYDCARGILQRHDAPWPGNPGHCGDGTSSIGSGPAWSSPMPVSGPATSCSTSAPERVRSRRS
jgi:hypothetical protein